MLMVKFPDPGFKIRQNEKWEEIFDPLRKSWVKLSPEEWVRQNFINYLLQIAGIPATLIAVERELKLGEWRKRFDIVVFDRNGLPWMMVECKSMDTELSEKAISQILSYLTHLPCRHMLITNGHYTYGWEIAGTSFLPLEKFPDFPAPVI